ncbi:MAG: metallophosphoesterase family protein [Desertimonas sp.]
MSELVELTTVTDDGAVFHVRATPGAPVEVDRVSGATPDTEIEHRGVRFRTLARPAGALRSRFGTVNDVHFGEVECGRLDDEPLGPILRAAPGEQPYPVTMNRAAVDEMVAADLAAVIAKGDLTAAARPDEFAAFDALYTSTFADRLHAVRGNHDAVAGRTEYAGDRWIELPGVAIALLDTAIPDTESGTLRDEQIEWLDDRAAASTTPVMVMGHHQQWISGERSPTYFGLHPDPSDALASVIGRRRAIVAYLSGHTHRHRVRRTAAGVPSIEIGCVKDFPGTWAEYRVYDGGIQQIVHRVSTPEALAWSERCRVLYSDFGLDYPTYALGTLDQRCFVIPTR